MSNLSAAELKRKAFADMQAGKLKSSVKKATLGTKKSPQDADFWTIAGVGHSQLKDFRKALPFVEKAHKLKPLRVDYIENLVVALEALEKTDRVCQILNNACTLQPDNEELAHLRAKAMQRNDMWAEAITAADHLIALAPERAAGYYIRGEARGKLNHPESDHDKAKAYEMAPENNLIAKLYASSLNQQGKPKESAEIYWSLVDGDGDKPNVLLELSGLVSREDAPKLLDYIKCAESEFDKPRHELAFATANLVDKLDGLNAAMPIYNEANALQQAEQPFSPKKETLRKNVTKKIFGKPLPDGDWPKAQAPTPIFIVGQPRSGTTLLEMMLSSSSKVKGCGELILAANLTVEQIFRDAPFTPADAHRLASEFRRLMPQPEDDAIAFVDKLPHNYRLIGFLAASFPNARFINLLRDPRDVALSTWLKRFPAAGMRYSSSMETMAINANNYRWYINFWNQHFSDQILTVQYEKLVSDPEGYGKLVTDFAGIPWDPAILHPEKNTASVRTASLAQVRSKIGTKSISKWKSQAEHLKPLIENLDPALWPEYDLSE